MTLPLTFGVEFEMSVVCGWTGLGEIDTTDKRTTSFRPRNPDGTKDWESKYVYEEMWKPVARHMAATLRAAGFPANVDNNDYTKWDFTSDISVEPPEAEPGMVNYVYASIELRSPAFYFTPESLNAVEDVLELLKRAYRINTNTTTGLHVHVGDGRKGWPFHMVHNLFTLVWAFESQINSLFPSHRIDGPHTLSMRNYSTFAIGCTQEIGRHPTPLEGVVTILSCEKPEDLVREFLPGTIRVATTAMHKPAARDAKPTIEFRHHDGTMDGVQTRMWIMTVVGIMEYLRDVQPAAFTDLLSIVEHEHWEKLGDGLDDEREREMGPILAESGFTIVDLLQTMGLYEPAMYYKKRGIHRIVMKPNPWNELLGGYYWLEGPGPESTPPEGDSREATSASDENARVLVHGKIKDTAAVLAAADELLGRREKSKSSKEAQAS
jgi:hypothetical protein